MRALVLAILIAVPVSARADEFDGPSPVIATVSFGLGATTINETATDGANGVGSSVGGTGTVLYKLAPRWSAGISIGIEGSSHDTDESDRFAVYTEVLAGVVGRMEHGRFGAMATAGYAFGRRTIRLHSTADEISDVGQHGLGIVASGFVRLKVGPVSFEVGPYVELAEMWSKGDEPATVFDEDGMRRQAVSAGGILQVAFGTSPIRYSRGH